MRGGRGNFRDKGLRLRGKNDWRIGKGYMIFCFKLVFKIFLILVYR